MESASKRDSRQTWRSAGGGVFDVKALANRRSRSSFSLSQDIVTTLGLDRARSHILRRSSKGSVRKSSKEDRVLIIASWQPDALHRVSELGSTGYEGGKK